MAHPPTDFATAAAVPLPLVLPALFRAADEASVHAQRQHLRLLKADLAGLVVGAVLTGYGVSSEANPFFGVAGAVSLCASLVLTLLLTARRGEHRWYGARFVAESVKTMSWRYMMRAEPYDNALTEVDADRRFVADLHEILVQAGTLSLHLGGEAAAEGQITRQMRETRRLPLEGRRALYRAQRIADQRGWYSRRSRDNESSGSRLMFLIISTQLTAVLAAVVGVEIGALAGNAATVLSTLAAACLAWLHARRHHELAQSYGIAAHELGLIAEHEHHVASEPEFVVFVSDAESAISREHTLWVARRDVPTIRKHRP